MFMCDKNHDMDWKVKEEQLTWEQDNKIEEISKVRLSIYDYLILLFIHSFNVIIFYN